MKIYSLTNYILFTSYLYLSMLNPIYVISYVIHKTIKNNFINFASGVCCLIYLEQINLTLTQLNYNYIIYGLSLLMLYLSFIEIYCNVFLSGMNIIIDLIKLISRKIVKISLYLNVSAFEHFIIIIDDIVNSMILISDENERRNIFDRLKFIFTKILQRVTQIERIEQTIREVNEINEINEINEGVIRETNSFESFVEQLNEQFPLRCRGLENNDNTANRINSTVCNICLEELNYNQLYRTITCSHSFHPHCIDLWLFQSKFCPICRTEIELRGSTNDTN